MGTLGRSPSNAIVTSASIADGSIEENDLSPALSGKVNGKADTTYVDGVAKIPSGKSGMLKGTASISNSSVQQGHTTFLHTGNGSTQNVVTGVNMKDNLADYSGLVQWSAGSYNIGQEVYIFDTSGRKLRCVCLQNGVVSDPHGLLDFTDAVFSDWKLESATFGGRVWIKNRDSGWVHNIFDTTRNNFYAIRSDTTDSEITTVTNALTAFNSDGFSVGSYGAVNGSPNSIVSWTDQTNYVESGLTNHNKPYIKETNTQTGYVQVKYKGSGLAGHEILHGLGRELGFRVHKNLSVAGSWVAFNGNNRDKYLILESTAAEGDLIDIDKGDSSTVSLINNTTYNTSNESYIMYGYTDSYYDDKNVLQGNYEVGVYQGSGAAGNRIKTRGRPAYVMRKRLDFTSNFPINDNLRETANGSVYANLSIAEITSDSIQIVEDGFILDTTDMNLSGGQYLYFVVYDNDSGTGKSKYTAPSSTSNLNLSNCIVSTVNGVDGSGIDTKVQDLGAFTFTPSNGWES